MKLKLISLALASTTLVSGCSMFNNLMFDDIREQEICFEDNGEVIECNGSMLGTNVSTVANDTFIPETLQDPTLFKSNVNFVLLSEYVEQMAMELRQTTSTNINSPVAVTSFVALDSTLKSTSMLGNQISEYFINELKKVGIPVSDYKVTGYIEVTPNGDLAMSRRLHELKAGLNIGNVLTGTLIQHERGVVVNARITSLASNNVIASSSKLIPNQVIR